MGGEILAIEMLIKALGFGIPSAILVFAAIVLFILTKFLKGKQDKDRNEHMKKWDSVIELHREAVAEQQKMTNAITSTHENQIKQLLDGHEKEINRAFDLHERQASTLDAMGHNLAIATKILETKHFCPNDFKQPQG